jgi:ubiquinone/menaquinone biosynthesis C-methylase UbiE
MRDPYASLAPVYDLMAAEPAIRANYTRWRAALLAAADERGVKGTVLVDIACGTGNSAIPWTRRRGWSVVGIDRSPAMLRVARGKSKAVRWIRQDLTEFDAGIRADFVTCHFDALNHVMQERDLQRVFRRVAAALRPGGLFQFDLNTVHAFRWLAPREKLFQAGPNHFTAFNAFDERTGVATFNQLWFIRRGRLFERRLVTVHERAFTEAGVRTMLARAGLRLLSSTVDMRYDGKPVRRLYLAVMGAARVS